MCIRPNGYYTYALVAQLVEHALSKRKVVGSKPIGSWHGLEKKIRNRSRKGARVGNGLEKKLETGHEEGQGPEKIYIKIHSFLCIRIIKQQN